MQVVEQCPKGHKSWQKQERASWMTMSQLTTGPLHWKNEHQKTHQWRIELEKKTCNENETHCGKGGSCPVQRVKKSNITFVPNALLGHLWFVMPIVTPSESLFPFWAKEKVMLLFFSKEQSQSCSFFLARNSHVTFFSSGEKCKKQTSSLPSFLWFSVSLPLSV